MADITDKNPPQSPDIERAVLGAMLLDKEAIGTAVEVLSRDHDYFYKPAHALIFRAITDLYDNNLPVDQLTTAERLKDIGKLEDAGGEASIAALAAETRSTANIRYHCEILREKALLRKMITITTGVRNRCFEESADPTDLLSTLEEQVMNIADLRGTRDFQSLSEQVYQAHEEIVRRAEAKGLTGVTSGFTRLDKLTSGWQSSDLIILAGRPSMGKTALALEFAKNAAQHDVPVGFFSLEMSALQLVMRMLFNEGRFDGAALHTRKPKQEDWSRLSDACSRLEKYPIYIDDTPGLSSIELSAKAKRLKRDKDIGMIIVDYLQLMQGTNRESRQQEISSISRSLKTLAKELNIPVIVLSQLSRAVEQRGGDHRPLLSDLRESGAIEQDADVVCLLRRPCKLARDDENDDETLAVVEVAKHRNGPTGDIRLNFEEQYTRFEDRAHGVDPDGPMAQIAENTEHGVPVPA